MRILLQIRTTSVIRWIALAIAAIQPLACAPNTWNRHGPNPRDMECWDIVIDQDATPAERYAANEFRQHFRAATGVDLPIRTEGRPRDRHVYIGPSDALNRTRPHFDTAHMDPEEFRIHIGKKRIGIAGGEPRGTLYGVYEFLEEYVGIRFLTPDHTHIPINPQVPIARGEQHYAPPFSFRWSFYRELMDDQAFAARLRNNTVAREAKFGGVTPQPLISHSIHHRVPAAKYSVDHPEYFALVDGERLLEAGGGGPQICSTNPKVVEIIVQSVLREIERHPNRTAVSVSPNDNALYCTCRHCSAVNDREESNMGAHLTLVNTVAERVESIHPHVKIGTLAYMHTQKPPRYLKPHRNVQIQLCSFEACTLHAINDASCPRNKAFCEDLDGWLALTNDVRLWYYVTNLRYLDIPFPNLRSIGPTLRYFRDRGVRGVFAQGNGRCHGGELSDLRNYVVSRLLWNPDLDADALVDEFVRLHYGPAAPAIAETIRIIHENAEATGVHPTCYSLPEESGLNDQVSRKVMALFDEALALDMDEQVRTRVEKASICAYKALIETGGALTMDNGMLRMVYPSDIVPRIARYRTLCQRFEMTRNAEFTSAEDYFEAIQSNQAGVPATRLENEVWRLTIAPALNGLTIEMLHKPSGHNLLKAFGSGGINVPHGALREWGVKGYDHQSPTACEHVMDGSSIVLTKSLPDGSTLRRTIGLSTEEPDTIEYATTFIHRGESPQQYQFWVRPELNAGPVPKHNAELDGYVLNGSWINFPIHCPLDESSLALLDDSPGGAVAFFNPHAGYGVQLTYQPGQFDPPYAAWNPALEQVDLDIFTKSITLRPGGAFSFRYQVKFLETPPSKP